MPNTRYYYKKLILPVILITLFSIIVSTIIIAGKKQDIKADAVSTNQQSSLFYQDKNASAKLKPVSKLALDSPIQVSDYKEITKSETHKLYLHEESLSVYIEDIQTGEVIQSTLSDENNDKKSNATWEGYMKSAVVLTAIVGSNNTFQVDLFNTPHQKEIEQVEEGYAVNLYYPEYKFGLRMEVTLDGDQLVVNIPEESIIEEKPGSFISTISIFPFMNYSHLDDEEGYMLIPDGNGALIYLDNKESRYSRGFSQRVYGADVGFSSLGRSYDWNGYPLLQKPNKILSPYFGIVHTNREIGFLGVIDSGQERAFIEAHPNGATVDYNRAYAKFLVRDIFVQPLNTSNSNTYVAVESDRIHEDMQVRYILVNKEAANYSGLANRYREYLLDTGILVKNENDYSIRVDFLGSDHENWLISTRPVIMTTIDDVSSIREELQNEGVEKLFSTFKGWQKGGFYNLPIMNLNTEKGVGSRSDLEALVQEFSDNNSSLYLYNDVIRLNPRTNSAVFNVIKQVNRRTFIEEKPFQVNSSFRFITPEKIANNTSAFSSAISDTSINNVMLAGISNELFTFNYSSRFYDRFYTSDMFEQLTSEFSEKHQIALEQPFDYLWKYAEALVDMPIQSSNYIYTNEEVPFLSMVLRGSVPLYSEYVNFEGNQKNFLLHLIESGVYPSFYVTRENSSQLINTDSAWLYSTEYNRYKADIIEWNKIFTELEMHVDGKTIVEHSREGSKVKVQYENGVEINLDYSTLDVEISDESGVTKKLVTGGQYE